MVESGSSWHFRKGVLRGDESEMKTVPILKHLLFSTPPNHRGLKKYPKDCVHGDDIHRLLGVAT